jgi:hypothetical protein
MFEKLRESLRDAMSRASSPSEGRAVLAMMREAIVEAKVGVSQIRSALDTSRAQLEHEQRELETVRRRGRLAADIDDQETVRVAAQFEQRYLARIDVLERKVAAQESELALAEREVAEMTSQLRAMASGASGANPAAVPPDLVDEGPTPEALKRDLDRAVRESTADRQLEELKRRMGR